MEDLSNLISSSNTDSDNDSLEFYSSPNPPILATYNFENCDEHQNNTAEMDLFEEIIEKVSIFTNRVKTYNEGVLEKSVKETELPQYSQIKDCQRAIMKLRRELDRVCENIVEIDLDNGNAHCMNMADGIIPDVFEEAIQSMGALIQKKILLK